MRILDCKSPICKEIAKDAPKIIDFLCEDCESHFSAVKTYLDAGFLPVLLDDPESDHAARWDKVRADLSYPAVTYVTPDALA